MTIPNKSHVFNVNKMYTMFWEEDIEDFMKKVLRDMQTLRAGESKAEPNFLAPPQTPSRGHRMAKI